MSPPTTFMVRATGAVRLVSGTARAKDYHTYGPSGVSSHRSWGDACVPLCCPCTALDSNISILKARERLDADFSSSRIRERWNQNFFVLKMREGWNPNFFILKMRARRNPNCFRVKTSEGATWTTWIAEGIQAPHGHAIPWGYAPATPVIVDLFLAGELCHVADAPIQKTRRVL
mmetsp:Transcript_55706/g.129912  ORF Transcript_55706/g.129912 Transcript_55706/m.129912 type:complete len:174 (+) Transcript_55706:838-1359(+)